MEAIVHAPGSLNTGLYLCPYTEMSGAALWRYSPAATRGAASSAWTRPEDLTPGV